MLVTGVEGQVFYGAGNAAPSQPVQAGQKLGPGTFSAGNDGILYLSAFDGSELRLAESATLIYDGDDRLCQMEGPVGNFRSNFHLKQGKAQITIRLPAQPLHCYHIVLSKAAASMAEGQCVMCMHGVGTYVFVARGRVAVTGEHNPQPPAQPGHGPEPIRTIEPFYGAVPTVSRTLTPLAEDSTQWLVGNGKVGVIGIEGDMRIVPLSALKAATQTCLLAGFNPDGGDGGGKKGGPDTGPVVSPTQ